MGQLQSKEECFYLSPDLDKAIGDKLWKKKTGFNLANYNMDESLSELSICLEQRTDSSPLRVELPPRRSETDTSKLLTLDHEDAGNHDNEGGHDRTKINIEEFECGVQFECSETAKQEWAFTLYDFDGHGKITKEDLASLLKALYDAVGSSIKLPTNGARSLKLRLTLGQENISHMPKPNIKAAERRKNANKTSRHKTREFSKMNNLTRSHLKRTNEHQGQEGRTHQTRPAVSQAEKKEVNSPSVLMSHPLGPDHLHLLELVQENLVRDHGRQFRKHPSESRNDAHYRYKRHHRASALHCPTTSAHTASIPACCDVGNSSKFTETTTNIAPKESQDRRNYYLDLAGVENNSPKVLNNVCVPTTGSSCRRVRNCKKKIASRDESFGATNGIALANDGRGLPSRMSPETGDISSSVPRENCDIWPHLQQERCGISSRVTKENCDISVPLSRENCDISPRLPLEKCGISSRVTKGKCDISLPLSRGKCDISLPLSQEKCDISSRLPQENCGISSRVTKENCDISVPLSQEKCDISSSLPHEKCAISSRVNKGKCDISLPLPRGKCDISSRLPKENCGISSRMTQEKCDISLRQQQKKCDISLHPPHDKCDTPPRLLQEKCDIPLRLQQEKCDVGSRVLQEKSFFSRLQGICDISPRLQPGKCDNVVKEESNRTGSKQAQGLPNNQQLRSKSLDVSEMPQLSKSPKSKKLNGWLNFSGGRLRPVSVPGKETLTVLPDYHRRHRHREKDRDVTMQQVAEWIEREHVDSGEAGRVVVHRHEHHHIHEHHHHHHFHHHHDT